MRLTAPAITAGAIASNRRSGSTHKYRGRRLSTLLDVLESLRNCDGEADHYEIEAESGYDNTTVFYSLKRLETISLVIKPRPRGKWILTERGKIALALVAGSRWRQRRSTGCVDANAD